MNVAARRNFKKTLPVYVCLPSLVLAVFGAQSKQTETKPIDSNPVVLNVTGDDAGMVGYWGKYIIFRLYRSSRAQYETYDEVYDRSTNSYKRQLVLHELKISRDETDKIIKLLEEPDLSNARDVYPKLITNIDAFYKETISFSNYGHEKQVVIENYLGSKRKDPGYYPKPLIELMSMIRDLVAKNRRQAGQ